MIIRSKKGLSFAEHWKKADAFSLGEGNVSTDTDVLELKTVVLRCYMSVLQAGNRLLAIQNSESYSVQMLDKVENSFLPL